MAKDFENARTKKQGVHYSRYIASWKNAGGDYYGQQFKKWLEENGCDDNEISDICLMAECGKMELEASAAACLKELFGGCYHD